MRERGATEEDVRHALANAAKCAEQENERWRVNGEDLNGDELTTIVAIEDGLIVVTLF